MTVQPTSEHVAFMDDLKAALGRHTSLTGMEMLAIASQFVGNLIALQDQRAVTADTVMDMVAKNIEIGNHAVIANLDQPEGRA